MVDWRDYPVNVKKSNVYKADWNFPVGFINSPLEQDDQFSLRSEMPDVIDQGLIPMCVGCAARASMMHFDRDRNLSALWLYHRAQLYDQWPGENYRGTSVSGVCDALRKEGACLSSMYDHLWFALDVDTSGALDGAILDASNHKVYGYCKLSWDRIDEIKELLRFGPLLMSMDITTAFHKPPIDGIFSTTAIEDADPVGGHAMAIIGYRTINKQLYWEVQNSWGNHWADNGYAFIPHSTLVKLSSSDVYVLIKNKMFAEDIRTIVKEVWYLKVKRYFLHYWGKVKRFISLR